MRSRAALDEEEQEHVGDGWVAIANQKHYVSLYTCGYHHIERFKQRCPRIKTGKAV